MKLKEIVLKRNSTRNIVILATIAFITYLGMLTNLYGLVQFDSSNLIDATIFYSQFYFLMVLNNLSYVEINSYLLIHLVDYVFIFTFYPALSLIFSRVNKNKSNIILLPILALIFDFLENIFIDIELLTTLPKFLTYLPSIFTPLKFSILLISIILIIISILKGRKYNV